MDQVILVDENDCPIGIEEKLKAHQEGKLHRAFSIFIFNSKNELLLQQRAFGKYHSEGLWSNTCCSHPRPKEKILDAAHRRLQEEMGFDCELKEIFSFVYKANLDKGLIENEFDHVLVGRYNDQPVINQSEAASAKWIDAQSLIADMQNNPKQYTFWFRECLGKVLDNIERKTIIF